jgi:hypothetical protein
MEQIRTEEKAVYEPPALEELAEFSQLTTGCGFNFFEWPAQHSQGCGF